MVFRYQLRRRQMLPFFKKQPSCLVGMEACATSHHWAREIEGLRHRVRLMPPKYVKPYVKRNKSDMADAEAICEAAGERTSDATLKSEFMSLLPDDHELIWMEEFQRLLR